MPITVVLFATGHHDGSARTMRNVTTLTTADGAVVGCSSRLPWLLRWLFDEMWLRERMEGWGSVQRGAAVCGVFVQQQREGILILTSVGQI